jgi:copper chaperone NosL
MSRGLALCAVLALACGRTPSWPPSPEMLRAGEEACAECRMFVSDARFAVQRHSRAGAVEWFDDLGCLISRQEPTTEPESVFVRDFRSEAQSDAWVRGDHGHAVLVPGLDSPMGHGWTVHASAADAQAAARVEGAQLVALSDLLLRGLPDAQRPVDQASATTNPGEDRR